MKKVAIRLISLGLVITTLVLVSCAEAGVGSDSSSSSSASSVVINPLNSQKPGELATTGIKVSWEPTKISGVTKDANGNATNADTVELELYYKEVLLGGTKPSISEVLASTKYTGSTLTAASSPVTINGLNDRRYYYVVIKNITAGDASNLVYKFTTYKMGSSKSGASYAPTTIADLKTVVNDEIDDLGDYADLNIINTSSVTDMSEVFKDKTTFNGDVSLWDVSQVTNMLGMFQNATAFSGDLSQWNVGEVTNMSQMFAYASAFNSDIKDWDVSKVTNVWVMFNNAKEFNQNLDDWETRLTNVTKWYDTNVNGAYVFGLSGLERKEPSWCTSVNKCKP